jgi:hydrogenase maturation protease
MSRVRVLGIGSPFGDDQAGWLTVDALLARGVCNAENGVQVHKLDRPGSSLVSLLGETDWVILIDAMQGNGSIGRIHRFDRGEWTGYSRGLSSHGFGVLEALSLASELGGLPPRLALYGIEIGSVEPGQPADARILAAAQQLAARIDDELADPGSNPG